VNIGQAAHASGISAKMIRHYESLGLLKQSRRSESGYRVYDEHDLHWLHFIRRARNLGFSLERIGDLLSLWSDQSRASVDVKKIAEQHIAELNLRIAELSDMRDTLTQLASQCQGDHKPDCPILRGLERPAEERPVEARPSEERPPCCADQAL
jgi:MerR family copper efflux transcriptional regulator